MSSRWRGCTPGAGREPFNSGLRRLSFEDPISRETQADDVTPPPFAHVLEAVAVRFQCHDCGQERTWGLFGPHLHMDVDDLQKES